MFNPYETNLHAFLFCLLGVKSGFYPTDLGKNEAETKGHKPREMKRVAAPGQRFWTLHKKVVSGISLGDIYNKVRERELYLEEPGNLGDLPGRRIELRQE